MHSHDTKRTSSPANGGGDRGRASPGASDRSTNLAVDGMTCSGCARNVTEALRAVPGVVSATVTLENRRAAVRWSPEATVNVEGHTDSDGEADANLALSVARAEAVVDQLILRSVGPERLYAIGYGESLPVESNDTRAGKQANRRIAFTLADE